MRPESKYSHHPAMRLLGRGLRNERLLMIGFATLLVGGGNCLGWYFFKKENPLAIFGLAAIVLGLRMAWNILRQPETIENRLFHLLENHPEKIVWVYSIRTQSMPYGFRIWDTGTMYFKLLDGDEISVSLPSGKLKLVSKFLNRVLPHAAFGYSDERRQQFEHDPALLRK